MTSGGRRNVAASARARLLNRSRETGEDFQSLLRRYAAERFLYRLGESRHRDRYVLKGGMLLALWGDTIYRPTRDLDFTGYGDSSGNETASAVADICAVRVPDDGMVFDTSNLTVEPIHEDGAYLSHRVRFEVTVAAARVRMQTDFGFGDSVYPQPLEVDYPVLLEAPRPRIRVYSPRGCRGRKSPRDGGERRTKQPLQGLLRHLHVGAPLPFRGNAFDNRGPYHLQTTAHTICADNAGRTHTAVLPGSGSLGTVARLRQSHDASRPTFPFRQRRRDPPFLSAAAMGCAGARV